MDNVRIISKISVICQQTEIIRRLFFILQSEIQILIALNKKKKQTMNPQAEELNQIIRQKSPSVYEMLSERGKNIFFPKKGILGQTAEAKGTRINATIGAAIEDDGTPMRLETIASKINLDPSLVFPYAPSFGRPDL